jgi:lipopolysaccharide transport system permease protein
MSQTKEIPLTVYTPESVMRSPGKLVRSMWRDLRASRELAWRLTVRDISAKYRQSAFGVLWAFLPPIAVAGLFVFLNRGGIFTISTTEIPYAAFALFGTVLWQTFTDALNTPIRVLAANKVMLSQINFPREALPLSAFGQVLFNFFIRLVILVAVFLIFSLEPTWGLLLFPLAVLMLMLLGFVIGMLLTPVGLLYTDITQGMIVITTVWLFVTPVLYPPPEEGILAVVTSINPVGPILVGARDLATLGIMPDAVPFAIVSGVSIIALFVMWVYYRISLPILIERMSA